MPKILKKGKMFALNTSFDNLKGRYHESVTNVRSAVVSLITVRRETCFPHSERFGTSSLDTSRILQEGRGDTTYRNVPTSS